MQGADNRTVILIGPFGAGKSTIAELVAAKTGMPAAYATGKLTISGTSGFLGRSLPLRRAVDRPGTLKGISRTSFPALWSDYSPNIPAISSTSHRAYRL